MFTKSAKFYDALYRFKDYSTAAERLRALIQHHNPGAKSLLDLGCGTGRHLEVMSRHYQVVGSDLNPELLALARQRSPDLPFYEGDMVKVNLGRTFDVVTCLFSAIGYVKTVDNLDLTVANMARHATPGGLIVVEPWFTPESYWTNRITANYVDEPDLKIAWMYTSEAKGRLSILDIHYLVGTSAGVDHFTEKHEIGLFTHEEYCNAFRKAGCSVVHDPIGLFNRGLYWGIRHGEKGETPQPDQPSAA